MIVGSVAGKDGGRGEDLSELAGAEARCRKMGPFIPVDKPVAMNSRFATGGG